MKPFFLCCTSKIWCPSGLCCWANVNSLLSYYRLLKLVLKVDPAISFALIVMQNQSKTDISAVTTVPADIKDTT